MVTAEVLPSGATRSNQPMNLPVAFGARRLSARRYAASAADLIIQNQNPGEVEGLDATAAGPLLPADLHGLVLGGGNPDA
jgi:hypothetical protein